MGHQERFLEDELQEGRAEVIIVVPISLQMGWIEPPPYFCAASEIGRDVAEQHMERNIGSIPDHKFVSLAAKGDDFNNLANF